MHKILELFSVLAVAVLCVHSQPAVTNVARIKECCEIVSGQDTCHSECLQFASTCPPAVANKTQHLESFCPEIPVELATCFDNLNQTSTPAAPTVSPELAECCALSPDQACVDVCLEQLLVGVESPESIAAVTAVCGTFLETPIWACFLDLAGNVAEEENPATNDNIDTPIACNATSPDNTTLIEPPEPRIPIYNADWGRLGCCGQTNASECKRACLLEYTGGRTSESWNTLNLDCKFRPTEESLAACLDDTISQCLPGCSTQLGFCENFNNRPLTLFRNCRNESDHNAKKDFTSWFTSGHIVHPLVTVPLTEKCPLDHLKTIACSFHLQPCQPDTHSTLICQEDCLTFMRDCSNSNTKTPQEICEILSPTHLQGKCISLEEFLAPSTYTQQESSSTNNPCNSQPCASGFKCTINADCLPSDKTCAPYKCLSACQLGLSPPTILEELKAVHVSTVPSGNNECFGYINRTDQGVCRFGQKESDVWNEYCVENLECEYNGVLRAHGEVFDSGDDCNFCVCKSGQVNCTRHICLTSRVEYNPLLSCHCHSGSCPAVCTMYAPVCTKDRRTMPNICFADCLGYNVSEVTVGGCRDEDPCKTASCPHGSRCLPNPHTCLTGERNSCPNYICETYTSCMAHADTLLCDKNGVNHHNLCDFIFKTEKVDYFGYCQDHCSVAASRVAVCGVNGETYASACHASGVGVAVDYIGECRDFPSKSTPDYSGVCPDVKCPSLPYFAEDEICTGPVPPGACCQQCGGMMRAIVDNTQLERNIAVLKNITFSQILDRLTVHMDVVNCTLTGYIALDGTYAFLASPVETSFLNVQLCNNEITRLASLINRRSPVIASDPFLSHLIAVNYTHASKIPVVSLTPSNEGIQHSAGVKSSTSSVLLLLSLVVLVLCTMAADVWQR